jgi:peptidoglycan pentaglycine glycine transferase (the first glycine)
LPNPHILQTWEWGDLKKMYGWEPLPQTWRDEQGKVNAAALVLQRIIYLKGISTGLKVLYIPRGPILDWGNKDLREKVLADLQTLCRKQGAILLKMDPEVVIGTGVPGSDAAQESPLGAEITERLISNGWLFSSDQIQFRNTMMMDLTRTEEETLALMKQKTRYNLRLAQKKGIQIVRGTTADLSLLYRMYGETSMRDDFVIRPEKYYLDLWQLFMAHGMAQPFLAKIDDEVIAGMVLFYFGGRAWYLHGMSRPVHREKMPNYLLQWEAFRYAQQLGCGEYDMWGAPDVFNESDSMWPVFRFKEGLGGKVVRTIGAWDYAPNSGLYSLYTIILPKLLDVMRIKGKKRTRKEVA